MLVDQYTALEDQDSAFVFSYHTIFDVNYFSCDVVNRENGKHLIFFYYMSDGIVCFYIDSMVAFFLLVLFVFND